MLRFFFLYFFLFTNIVQAALPPPSASARPAPVSPGRLAAAPSSSDYRRLQDALKVYRKMAKRGGWPVIPPGAELRKGDQNDRVAVLRRRLLVSGELKENDPESEFLFDPDLEDAVKLFQQRHALNPTGEMDAKTRLTLNIPVQEYIHALEQNSERWRWLPPELGPRYVLVDIAGFRVMLYDQGKRVLTMRAIVGGKGKETPIFTSEITQVALNPWWNIPHEIAVKEVLPALQEDPEEVIGSKVEVGEMVKGRWSPVDPSTVDWTKVSEKGFRYRLRQAPGPVNPLGAIKFNLPNHYSIYLHGTADPELFESDSRAVSHGCVRVEKPVELAMALLGPDGPKGWTEEKLREALKSGKQVTISLPTAVKVYFGYFTTWADDDGEVNFRKDVYGWDEWDQQVVNSFRFAPESESPVGMAR